MRCCWTRSGANDAFCGLLAMPGKDCMPHASVLDI